VVPCWHNQTRVSICFVVFIRCQEKMWLEIIMLQYPEVVRHVELHTDSIPNTYESYCKRFGVIRCACPLMVQSPVRIVTWCLTFSQTELSYTKPPFERMMSNQPTSLQVSRLAPIRELPRWHKYGIERDRDELNRFQRSRFYKMFVVMCVYIEIWSPTY
jgi:hypothetical protein